jgi:hypothetical protein
MKGAKPGMVFARLLKGHIAGDEINDIDAVPDPAYNIFSKHGVISRRRCPPALGGLKIKSNRPSLSLFPLSYFLNSATVTPAPPSDGSPGLIDAISGCFFKKSVTAALSAPVPKPWITVTTER